MGVNGWIIMGVNDWYIYGCNLTPNLEITYERNAFAKNGVNRGKFGISRTIITNKSLAPTSYSMCPANRGLFGPSADSIFCFL